MKRRLLYTSTTILNINSIKLQKAMDFITVAPIMWTRVGTTRYITEVETDVKAELYVGSAEYNSELFLSLGTETINKEVHGLWWRNWDISIKDMFNKTCIDILFNDCIIIQ